MSSNCGFRLFRVVHADEEWIKLLFACSVKTPSGTGAIAGAIVTKAKAVFHSQSAAKSSDSFSVIQYANKHIFLNVNKEKCLN